MTNQKSKVLRTAWAIKKSGYAESLSIALKKAWIICKLSFGLKQTIAFAKVETGELRTAKAIQVGSLETIKDGFVRFLEDVDGLAQWKSFRIANLITEA
jgi:hypothetical protein